MAKRSKSNDGITSQNVYKSYDFESYLYSESNREETIEVCFYRSPAGKCADPKCNRYLNSCHGKMRCKNFLIDKSMNNQKHSVVDKHHFVKEDDLFYQILTTCIKSPDKLKKEAFWKEKVKGEVPDRLLEEMKKRGKLLADFVNEELLMDLCLICKSSEGTFFQEINGAPLSDRKIVITNKSSDILGELFYLCGEEITTDNMYALNTHQVNPQLDMTHGRFEFFINYEPKENREAKEWKMMIGGLWSDIKQRVDDIGKRNPEIEIECTDTPSLDYCMTGCNMHYNARAYIFDQTYVGKLPDMHNTKVYVGLVVVLSRLGDVERRMSRAIPKEFLKKTNQL